MTRFWRKAVSLLLGAAIGPAACTSTADEYGVPHATFKLDGQVVSAENEEGIPGIPGIRVMFQDAFTQTDQDGMWSIHDEWLFPCRDSCVLEIHDIDGNENGLFADKVKSITPVQTEAGSGGWNRGTYELSDIIIELQPADGEGK